METYATNSLGKKLIAWVQNENNGFKVDIMIIKKQNVKATFTRSFHIITFHDIVWMECVINNVYEQDQNEALYDNLFIFRE